MKISDIKPIFINSNIEQKSIKKGITDTISGHKKLFRKTLGMTGILGVAFCGVMLTKPANAKADIYNDFKNAGIEVNENKIKYEEELKSKNLELKAAEEKLQNDINQKEGLATILQIPNLRDKEYYQQQHDVLIDFIKIDQEQIESCKKEIEEYKENYNKYGYKK